MKTIKYYIATGFHNKKAHREIRQALSLAYLKFPAKFHLTYDWTVNPPAASVKEPGFLQKIAAAEIEGVRSADVLIVVMPGGVGTHAELGMALAMNKPVFIFTNDRDTFESETACPFYFAPNVHRVIFDGAVRGVVTVTDRLYKWALGKDEYARLSENPKAHKATRSVEAAQGHLLAAQDSYGFGAEHVRGFPALCAAVQALTTAVEILCSEEDGEHA